MSVDIGLVIGPLVGSAVYNLTSSNLMVILASSVVFGINVVILLIWQPPARVSAPRSTSTMAAQSVTDADVLHITEFKKITFEECLESVRPKHLEPNHVHTFSCYFRRGYCEFTTGVKALWKTVKNPKFGSMLLGRSFVVLSSDVCHCVCFAPS